jgi:hypothetical protein
MQEYWIEALSPSANEHRPWKHDVCKSHAEEFRICAGPRTVRYERKRNAAYPRTELKKIAHGIE